MGRLLDYYSSDENEREDQKIRNSKPDTKPAISVPAPNANVEVFFPWNTDFKDEPTYLETVLGKEVLDVSTEQEDCQRIAQNDENLFLAEMKRRAVRKF